MENNLIGIYPNAIPDDMLDSLVHLFNSNEEHQSAGEVSDGSGGGIIKSTMKDSSDLNLLEYEKTDEISPMELYIFPKLSKCLDKVLIEYCKTYQMTPSLIRNIDKGDDKILETFYHKYSFWPYTILMKKYKKGIQGFHQFHEDNTYEEPHNRRAFVVMFYLADVEEGGETEFHIQKVKVKPEKGTIVIFPAYWTHLHKGHIPISNDKYICNFWIMRGHNEIPPTIEGKWNHYATDIKTI